MVIDTNSHELLLIIRMQRSVIIVNTKHTSVFTHLSLKAEVWILVWLWLLYRRDCMRQVKHNALEPGRSLNYLCACMFSQLPVQCTAYRLLWCLWGSLRLRSGVQGNTTANGSQFSSIRTIPDVCLLVMCMMWYAGFQNRMRASAEFAYKVPDSMSSEEAAPMMCAGKLKTPICLLFKGYHKTTLIGNLRWSALVKW